VEKNNSKNVKLIIILALCLVFSDLNCVNNTQGSCSLSFGWLKVSKVPKVPKISEICCFDIQSTKNKVKKRHINVNKWLKIAFKYYCVVFSDHFKPISNFLAL
jgi:hypothetical protein